MTTDQLVALVQGIVGQTTELKNAHTGETGAPVNYAAIFSQNEAEYRDLLAAATTMGRVVEETATGPLVLVPSIATIAGPVRLIKVRQPDTTRPERGDADFTVDDYLAFKRAHLSQNGFKLIERPGFEMIELVNPRFNVRAYFSHPPLSKQLGIENES